MDKMSILRENHTLLWVKNRKKRFKKLLLKDGTHKCG